MHFQFDRPIVVFASVLGLFACSVHAQDDWLIQAEQAIGRTLPSGWSIVQRDVGEIPWGHHWCDKYKGVTGTKLVVRGPQPSRTRFLGRDDQWRDIVVGAEALQLWVMPRSYSERRTNLFCSHRPIQPIKVVTGDAYTIYARPAHHANADEKQIFDKQLAESKAVESPESPWNDWTRISWRTWEANVKASVERGPSQ